MTENFTKDNSVWIHNSNGNLQTVRVIQTSKSPLKTSLTTIKVPISEIQNKIKGLKVVKVNNNSVPDLNSKLSAINNNIVKREPIDPADFEDSHLEPENRHLEELDLIEILDSRSVAENLCRAVSLSLAGQAVSNYSLRVASENGPLAKVMSYSARKRSNVEEPQQEYTTKRRRHADKVGKGLRHFSMKVCEKVRNKGFTSYNEVADELVTEFTSGIHGATDSQHYDQKNIRRRVYDALNVLMAMNIISKEKKEIRWLGLPTNSAQECTTLEIEKQNRVERINKKTQQLEELLLQHISFKSLIERNKDSENRGVKPSPSSAIHLPFIVVNTTDKALIDCSISNDKTEYMFNFNKKFQIHDDIDILKRMGLLHGLDQGECTEDNIRRIKTMVPKSLEHYVEMMGRGNSLYFPDAVEDSDQEEEDDCAEQMLDAQFKVEVADEDEDNDNEDHESSDEGSDVDV